MTVVSGALLSIGIIPQLSNGALSQITGSGRRVRPDEME